MSSTDNQQQRSSVYTSETFRWRYAKEEDMVPVTAIFNEVLATSNNIYQEYEVNVENRILYYDERIKNNYPFIVAIETNVETGKEEVIGYATYCQFRPFYGYRYTVEHSVYVRNDKRGKGLGDCLLSKIMDIAKERDLHVLIAGIDSENVVAIKIHEKHGFVEVGKMPEVGFKKGQWLTLVLMQKIL
jgi:L-amino acid N-acyltransferase YncA